MTSGLLDTVIDWHDPAVVSAGRTRRSRLANLLIAATAHAHGLDLYTRNGSDFEGIGDLVRVISI